MGPRIICRQVLSNYINCTYLESEFIIDQSVFIAKFSTEIVPQVNPKFVLAQLCSRLVVFYFKFKANEFDALFPKIKIGEFRELPIKICDSHLQLIWAKKVDTVLNDYTFKLNTTSKFQTFFTSQYKLEKLSRKLENWHELEYGEFIKELNKSIKANNKLREKAAKEAVVSSSAVENRIAVEKPIEVPALTKKDEFEWMSLFEENKKKAQDLQTQIDATEREIDQMVYELYGLTEEEIQIVENS